MLRTETLQIHHSCFFPPSHGWMFSSSCLSFCIYCIVYVHISGWMPLLRGRPCARHISSPQIEPESYITTCCFHPGLQRSSCPLPSNLTLPQLQQLWKRILRPSVHRSLALAFWFCLLLLFSSFFSRCCFCLTVCFVCVVCLAWRGTENMNLLWFDSCLVIYFVINLHRHFKEVNLSC